MTLGQARRLGLGMPIAGGPIAPGSAAFSGPLPDVGAGGPVPQRSPEPAVTEPAPVATARDQPLAQTSPLAASPDPAPWVGAPSGRFHLTSPSVSGLAVSARPLAASGPAAARPTAAGRSAPIVSAQPLRAGVQRAPLTLQANGQREPAATGSTTVTPGPSIPAGGPVKVNRDSSAGQLSQALDARSFTKGGEIFLPASHGPITSGKGRSLLAHELTHVTQQRKLGSSLPEEHTPHGQALEAEAVAAERSADMPLASGPHASESPAAHAAHATQASKAPDLSTPPAATSPTTSTAESPHAQRAPASPAGQGQGAGLRHTEQELEDLARQLYSRIGRQLKREILVDRERAGYAMDLR